MFADYFEPEVIYHVKVGYKSPEGTVLNSIESEVRAVEMNLTEPLRPMEMDERELMEIDEFQYAILIVDDRVPDGSGV
jgi:hypothetical protein